MRNVVLDGVGKENSADILYQKVLQYSSLQHNEVIALEVLQNDVKFITQYFLVVNKSPRFLIALSEQNLLQLNMSKNMKALRKRH